MLSLIQNIERDWQMDAEIASICKTLYDFLVVRSNNETRYSFPRMKAISNAKNDAKLAQALQYLSSPRCQVLHQLFFYFDGNDVFEFSGDEMIDILNEKEFAHPRSGDVITDLNEISVAFECNDKCQLDEIVRQTLFGANNAPKINIVEEVSDLPVSVGITAGVKGMYYKRQVYLIIPSLLSGDDAEFVLRHEVFGHAGLRLRFGKKLGALLRSIEASHKEIAKSAYFWRKANEKRKNKHLSNKKFFELSIEEALCDMAGDKIECQSFEKFRSPYQVEIRDCWLGPSSCIEQLRLNFKVINILKKARKHIMYGKSRTHGNNKRHS